MIVWGCGGDFAWVGVCGGGRWTTTKLTQLFLYLSESLAPGQIRRPDNSVLYLALHGLLRAATRLTCIFVSPSAKAWSVIFLLTWRWNFMPKSTLVSGWWKVTQEELRNNSLETETEMLKFADWIEMKI